MVVGERSRDFFTGIPRRPWSIPPRVPRLSHRRSTMPTPAKAYTADLNKDGTVSRKESKTSNITVSAGDLNDDGRVTRSEAARMAKTKLGPPKFLSLE